MGITSVTGSRNIDWDDPRTVLYYEAFCSRYDRYAKANEALVARAGLEPGQQVLDLAAGTGCTAEGALPLLGAGGRILCMEPSAAMRAAGEVRLPDQRITWSAHWPEAPTRFDRILCGAAIWLLLPLDEVFDRLRGLLDPEGALCFNIPSLYLGEPDEPGGGRDPLLLELPALLSEHQQETRSAAEQLPDAKGLESLLAASGFRCECWTFRVRLTQEAYREWLKIPVMTNRLMADLNPDERARRLDEAFLSTDPTSWRWERWRGWTAWAQ